MKLSTLLSKVTADINMDELKAKAVEILNLKVSERGNRTISGSWDGMKVETEFITLKIEAYMTAEQASKLQALCKDDIAKQKIDTAKQAIASLGLTPEQLLAALGITKPEEKAE